MWPWPGFHGGWVWGCTQTQRLGTEGGPEVLRPTPAPASQTLWPGVLAVGAPEAPPRLALSSLMPLHR